MKRRTFSCEFLNGCSGGRDALTAYISESGGVEHQKLLPVT